MKTVAIIQARMGSTRLPGKVLKPLLGKPMLARMLERVTCAKKVDAVVVATSDKPQDDGIEQVAREAGAQVFRGSEDDVLDRVYRAAKEARADIIVALTGDCVLHDPAVIDEAVRHFIDAGDPFAYSGTPANYPEGLDTDIFNMSALTEAAGQARLPSEREHLSVYFKNRPGRFHGLPWSVGGRDDCAMHWSVDTPQDFAFVTKIFEQLYPINPQFGKDDVLALLARRPELLEINKGGTGYEGLAKSKKRDEEWMRARRLVLGTVEFGMEYGIDGQLRPAKDETFAILDAALAAGIDTFDTASAYGNAEELLGGWIKARSCADKVKIISKGSGRADIEQSLKRLGLRALDGYLLHNAQGSLAELQEARRALLVKHIGASVYRPEEVRSEFEYVQIPYNALDRRFEKVQGAVVFARSPFLQGLLLMNPNNLPPHLAHAKPYLEQFVAIANNYKLSQLQASLLFVLHSNAHYVVFGVKSLAQLHEILEAAKTPVPDGFIDAVRAGIQNVDETVINPSLWKR